MLSVYNSMLLIKLLAIYVTMNGVARLFKLRFSLRLCQAGLKTERGSSHTHTYISMHTHTCSQIYADTWAIYEWMLLTRRKNDVGKCWLHLLISSWSSPDHWLRAYSTRDLNLSRRF